MMLPRLDPTDNLCRAEPPSPAPSHSLGCTKPRGHAGEHRCFYGVKDASGHEVYGHYHSWAWTDGEPAEWWEQNLCGSGAKVCPVTRKPT